MDFVELKVKNQERKAYLVKQNAKNKGRKMDLVELKVKN